MVLTMCRALNRSRLWMFQDCRYVRVLNFHCCTGFTYGRVLEGFWISQDSKYTGFLHMQALHKVLNMPECGWICLNVVWINCSNYDSVSQGFKYVSDCNARAPNIARLWIYNGYTVYWIRQNMRGYALIMLNMLEYPWIYLNKQSSEYTRILNVSDSISKLLQITELLLRQRLIQNIVKHLRWSVLQNEKYLNMCQYAVMSLNMDDQGWILLKVPEYAWKCLNKLFWLGQGSQYASSSYILNRILRMPQVLYMPGFWICCDLVIMTLFYHYCN